MKVKNEISVHNNYTAKVIGSDGKVKQEGYAENIVTDRFWAEFPKVHLWAIGVGTGSPASPGLLDPAATSLINKLGIVVIEDANRKISEEVVGTTLHSTHTLTVSIPATSQYVGEITEVGIISQVYGYPPLSHALFKDSEGNPISITKTENDIMVIEAIVYLVVNYAEGTAYIKPKNNYYTEILRTYQEPSGSNSVSLQVAIPPELNSTGQLHGAITHNTSPVYDRSIRSLTYNKKRTLSNDGNYGFANYILYANSFAIKLPNANHFPNYVVEDISIGLGNGVRNSFDCPVPEFIKNTDIVKVDGVPLLRGVDYVLDNKNNGNQFTLASNAKSSKFPRDVKPYSGSLNNSYIATGYGSDQRVKAILTYAEPISFEGICVHNSTDSYSLVVRAKNNEADSWTDIYTGATTAGKQTDWHSLGNTTEYKYWEIGVPLSRNINTPVWLGDEPGPGLVFTNPPANGAVITITCEVDRPFKTEDFAFDTSFVLNY